MKTFNYTIMGLVWILFIWFMIASYMNGYKVDCPVDTEMGNYLINYGADRIPAKESCYEGCYAFIEETGRNINCGGYCGK